MTEKRILMVIAPSDFRDEEFFEPYNYFTQEKNWSVTVASTQKGVAKGMLGKTWPVEETIDNLHASQFDALVIAGGMGSPTFLWDNQTLLQLVRDFNQQRKAVSAICLSGVVLAKAGILKDRKATVYEIDESIAEFEKAGATYIKNKDVVVDENIITANGPHAASDFAYRIADYMLGVPIS